MEGVRPVKHLSYSTIRVCFGVSVLEGNCIAILALPICPMVSSTNVYQMGLKMGKVLL